MNILFVFVPVGKRANWDILFEQGAWLGSAQAMRFVETHIRKTQILEQSRGIQVHV